MLKYIQQPTKISNIRVRINLKITLLVLVKVKNSVECYRDLTIRSLNQIAWLKRYVSNMHSYIKKKLKTIFLIFFFFHKLYNYGVR